MFFSCNANLTPERKRRQIDEDVVDFLERPSDGNKAAAYYHGDIFKNGDLSFDIKYDTGILDHFDGNHGATKRWIEEVIEHTQSRFKEASLPMSITLKVNSIQYVDANITATVENLKALTKEEVDILTVYFGYDPKYGTRKGKTGYTYVGCACEKEGLAVVIVELSDYYEIIETTSRTLAHELGHTIGMR